MNSLTIGAVNRIYLCSDDVKIKRARIKDEGFRNFCFRLKNFENTICQDKDDEYWKPFLRGLRRYRFIISAGIFSFNHSFACPPDLLSLIDKYYSQCHLIFPDYAEKARELIECFRQIKESHESPILQYISRMMLSKKTGLVLKESYLIPEAEKVLSKYQRLSDLEIVSVTQLKSGICYDCLVLVGTSLWFPEYIFNAPRTREINLLCYSWIRDDFKIQPSFIADTSNGYTLNIDNIDAGIIGNEDIMDSDEISPSFNWSTLQISPFTKSHRDIEFEGEHEEIEANLLLLEGDAAVFIENDDSRILVIDPDEGAGSQGRFCAKVKKIPTSSLSKGMFIVLRTLGSGDYLIPTANKILGEKADYARKMQATWKTRLRIAVRSNGVLGTADILASFGSPLANDVNVRNWISDSSIRPRNYEDFLAIMKLVLLEKEANEYWNVAKTIEKAHIKAGFQISRQLISQVMKADLTKLEKLGMMDFEIPGADGGSLTAFRILDISPEHYRVPVSGVRQLIGRSDI